MAKPSLALNAAAQLAPLRPNIIKFPSKGRLRQFTIIDDSMSPELRAGQIVEFTNQDGTELPAGCIGIFESKALGVLTAGRGSCSFKGGVCMLKIEFKNPEWADLEIPLDEVRILGVVVL